VTRPGSLALKANSNALFAFCPFGAFVSTFSTLVRAALLTL